MTSPLRQNSYLALAALLTSFGTLVCCVLPAIMVAMGAGATLASVVSAVPQLVWFSEQKMFVFGVAAVVLAVAGASIWRARMLPCPSDPVAARACVRLRRFSAMLYALSALVFCIGVTFAFVLPAFSAESSDRQTAVRQRGAGVMTFSLDATQHIFKKTADGGVQRVITREGHSEQVPMIREHLQSIAHAFGSRNFSGPTHIHGADMAGLAQLKAAPSEDLRVTYREIEGGAEVTYAAQTPVTIRAIHQWFDAQLADHASDAADHE